MVRFLAFAVVPGTSKALHVVGHRAGDPIVNQISFLSVTLAFEIQAFQHLANHLSGLALVHRSKWGRELGQAGCVPCHEKA